MKEVEKIIEKIKSYYSPNDILGFLDDEVYNWDYGFYDDEIDEFESRWDFYSEYNNKEAEDVIIDYLLNTVNLDSNTLFSIDEGVSYYLFTDWLEDYTSHSFI